MATNVRIKVYFQDDCHKLVLPLSSMTLARLRDEIASTYFPGASPTPDFIVKYLDDDDDLITISREDELAVAVDQFSEKTLKITVILKPSGSAASTFASPVPAGPAPASAHHPLAPATVAGSILSPRNSALQAHSGKKVSFRPNPVTAVVGDFSSPRHPSEGLHTPQRAFHASTSLARHHDSPTSFSPAFGTPNASSSGVTGKEDALSPETIARNKQLLGDDYAEGEIVQMLRDISYFISTIVEEELVSHISQKSLITSARSQSGEFQQAGSPASQSRAQQHVLNLSNIREWSVEQVAQWMSANGFGEYIPLFKENDIDGEALLALDHETLRSMSIGSAGKRLKVLRTIAALSLFAAGSAGGAGAELSSNNTSSESESQ